MISTVICMSLRGVWHCCNLPCVYALFWLVSIASYVLKSRSICFQGKKYDINREDVVYLHSTLWHWALYCSLQLACGEDNFSLVILTLAVTKSTSKSQNILIYGSPEVEWFQINSHSLMPFTPKWHVGQQRAPSTSGGPLSWTWCPPRSSPSPLFLSQSSVAMWSWGDLSFVSVLASSA